LSANGQFEGTGTLQKIHDVKEPARAAEIAHALPLRRNRKVKGDRTSKINFPRPAGAAMSERSLAEGGNPRAMRHQGAASGAKSAMPLAAPTGQNTNGSA